MSRILLVAVVFVALSAEANAASQECCKCDDRGWAKSVKAMCLTRKDMRDHVIHFEPLRPSGLGNGLNIAGVVILDIRFGPAGSVECARAKSGHPIAISAAVESVRKWTFRPVIINGAAKSGCGRVSIRYRLRDQGSESKLQ